MARNEMLDIYDENENHIGTEDRDIVHAKGLWHKTTHCWLIQNGMIMFQQRSMKLNNNPGKLYTTASGHLSAGETPKQGLQREVSEECGIELDTTQAVQIDKVFYKADFTRTDGTEFHDRAIAEVYILETDADLKDFDFQDEELDGIFAVPIEKTLNLFKTKLGQVKGLGVIKENGEQKIVDKIFTLDDFLALNHETHYEKYGKVLESAKEYFDNK